MKTEFEYLTDKEIIDLHKSYYKKLKELLKDNIKILNIYTELDIELDKRCDI